MKHGSKNLLLLSWLFMTFSARCHSEPIGWDDYNDASLEAIDNSSAQNEPFSVDLNALTGDPNADRRMAALFLKLWSTDETEVQTSASAIVKEVELVARAQSPNVLNAQETQRRFARGLIDALLQHSLAVGLRESLKQDLRHLVQDRFIQPEEQAILASELELRRRTTRSPRSPQSRRDEAMETETIRSQWISDLNESLSLSFWDRANTLKFWNATEEAFNRLEINCGELSQCESLFQQSLATLLSQGRIDEPTKNKLTGFFLLRTASPQMLQEFKNRNQSATTEASPKEKNLEARTLAFKAANELAAGFVPSVRLDDPNTRYGFLFVVFIFFMTAFFAYRKALRE